MLDTTDCQVKMKLILERFAVAARPTNRQTLHRHTAPRYQRNVRRVPFSPLTYLQVQYRTHTYTRKRAQICAL